VNSMHDSFTPLGGMVPLVNIELGEVIFGGVGAGLYGMLMYAILAVFLAGLMVGRTPEYLGKKIEQKEVKMAMLAMLVLAASILLFSAGGIMVHASKNAWINPPGAAPVLTNNGPHGLSEMLYAYTSATGNNGSAFGGFIGNTPFFNTTMGYAMLIGRFLMMIPLLAAAGSLAKKKMVPVSAGTFPTHGSLFVAWLVGVIVIVGALTFFPALCLGPVVEHFLMYNGKLFSVLIAGVWS
jgi:K+-transporting ATPase ATPase A chain